MNGVHEYQCICPGICPEFLLCQAGNHFLIQSLFLVDNIMPRFSCNSNQDTWFFLSIFLASMFWFPLILGFIIAVVIELYSSGHYPVLTPLTLYVFGPIAYTIGLFGFIRFLFFGVFFTLFPSVLLLFHCLKNFEMNISFFFVIIFIFLTIFVCVIALQKIASAHELFFNRKNILLMIIISIIPSVLSVVVH